MPLLASEQLGLMVWSPLAGGYLTGKYADDGHPEGARQTELDFPPIDRVRGEPLRENVQATEVQLDPDDMARLDSISRLPIEYPGWLLNAPSNRGS